VKPIGFEFKRLEDGDYQVRVDGEDVPFFITDTANYSEDRVLEGIKQILLTDRWRMHTTNHNAGLISSKLLPAAAEECASKPPAIAEMLFTLFAPSLTVNAQLGDLQELFHEEASRVGQRRARQRYWMRVIRSIGPLLYGKLVRIGFIGFLVELSRKKMGL
jgi:hypothetical protein